MADNRIRHLSKVSRVGETIIVTANNTGNEFIFDNNEVNFNYLSKFTWQERPNGHLGSSAKNKSFFAHHFIYGDFDVSNYVVDHKDRNPKNNRRSNLRLATNAQNRINAKINSNNGTGFKGVSYREKTNRYRAYIHINKKSYELGTFKTAEEAYIARARKEIECYGEYANIHPDYDYLKGEVSHV